MASPASALLLATVAGGLSWVMVGIYARAMSASNRLESPNERSMHTVPVPVGAGVGIVATALLLWPLWQGSMSPPQAVLLASFAGLGAMSWVDDRRGLPVVMRLAGQAMAVGACLALVAPQVQLLPALPIALERILLGLAWLWFINLFNFMDGIDGLAGSETIAVALGYLLLAYLGMESGALWDLAVIIAASTAGYLFWNWPPAKVFMGDAGSVPLGFLLGWLMLDLAFAGYWAAAVILPLYFVADATFTICNRSLQRKRPWQAHREHFYQRAVLGGTTALGVVGRVSAANAALVVLALLSARYPSAALAAAAGVVAALLLHLRGLANKRSLAGTPAS
jgi:UDP-N-acetylmuramyl pentapeptide phosphotransferase/UDP-N-acetylglucosamine-1-phosphate transferase